VKAITAAEIQSADPKATAARWSEIAQIPVTAGPSGAPQLRLDDATVRFIVATDGRGEGLGGLDLRAADRGAVLAAAQERRLARGDGQVQLCGMRINLV
jgi:hypothetical protein